MDTTFDSVFISGRNSSQSSSRGNTWPKGGFSASAASWWSRTTVADHTNVRSLPGMVAARCIMAETKSGPECKDALHHSMYARDAREGFARRALDPSPQLRPAGACLPQQRAYPLKKRFH
mmetsp:Transcript_86975/g.246607  ORF Transcript_86975/g.246607 Transcript_86975/m.246607 type:complete len:120 (-) Transcript_86975:35-394(-)